MKRTLLCTLCSLMLSMMGVTAWGQVTEGVYQIPNSDFETWNVDNEPGNGWNSFESATGVPFYVNFKTSSPQPSKYNPAHAGSCAVKLSSMIVAGKKANGNLTTGIVNMGSMTPSNAANYNFTKRDDSSHSLKFKGLPDAAECYAIFKSGGSPNGRLQFIIHGDINYCDPETSNGQQNNENYLDYKVGSAAIIINACTAWQRFTAEFTYTGNDKTPQVHYMLASATTNPTPGGSVNDELCLDDVKLIYYHSLSSCTYDNQKVVFDTDNNAKVDALYDESKLAYEKKGVGATVEKSYDDTTCKLTITVKGNDFEANTDSKTVYTIQFADPTVVVSSKEYVENLYVSVDGYYATPSSIPVTVETRRDGKINFLLNNFTLELVAGDDPMYIGNIKVDALAVKDGKFSCQDKTVDITAGNLDGVSEDQWMGPILSMMGVKANMDGSFVGDNNIKTYLTIAFEDMNINVHLGYTPTIATMAVKEGCQYGTFYAPFDVTLPSGVKAYTCEAMEANGYTLKLTSVDGTIAAKTAIIVEASEAVSQNFYNFDEDLKLENGSTGFLYGVAEGGKTSAPMGSYVLQNQNGNEKFFLVTKETGDLKVSANRCYLQLPADKAGVKAISFPGDATAIDAINALVSGKAEIYDLQGRRLSALQKGINVVNGRKVMVK